MLHPKKTTVLPRKLTNVDPEKVTCLIKGNAIDSHHQFSGRKMIVFREGNQNQLLSVEWNLASSHQATPTKHVTTSN